MQKLSSLAFKKETHSIEGTHLSIDTYRLALEPGQITVVASCSGMGRTTLMLYLYQLLYQKYRKPQLFLSNEVHEPRLYRKIVASVSGVALDQLDVIPDALVQKHEVLRSDECQFCYLYENWHKLKAVLDNWGKENRNGFLFLDKLEGVFLSGPDRNRSNDLRFFLTELKSWASEYQISVLVAAGVRRTERNPDYVPSLMNLKNGSVIEDFADAILLLYRASYFGLNEDEEGNNLRNYAELYVAKNCWGPLVTLKLYYDAHIPCFRPYDRLERMAFGNPALDKLAHQFGLESPDKDVPF